ncbi:sensor histidine kinase [Jiangella aurantiaca]|uniref:sensor histidine kinase n=1 Tax=Jiangella aurantiaca TaxID=2530373 RepID=UPI0013A5EAE9|nr:histidine kinase [Jiangella aurantiaca]
MAVVLIGTLSQLSHGGIAPTRPGSTELDPLGVLLAACGAVPLLSWRRSPLGAFVATSAVSVLLAGFGYSVDLALGPTIALYLLTASRDRDAPWPGRITAIVVGLLVAYLGATAAAHQTFPGIELLHTGLAWTAAWFAGERTHLRREQLAEFRARAHRAERDAERERLLAVAEERARIARDLHDSAGHAINVIAVRAGAARLRHHDEPDRSLPALTAIEELARQTADDIDRIVATLRDSGPSDGVEAPTGLASLDTLIAHHTSAGLDVTLETTDAPGQLDRATDQAAYRILQEALTNAARHGAGSATIILESTATEVRLTVINPVADRDRHRPSGGHGLIGMQERATLLGGSFDAQRVDGAFRVHVRLPNGGRRT